MHNRRHNLFQVIDSDFSRKETEHLSFNFEVDYNFVQGPNCSDYFDADRSDELFVQDKKR